MPGLCPRPALSAPRCVSAGRRLCAVSLRTGRRGGISRRRSAPSGILRPSCAVGMIYLSSPSGLSRPSLPRLPGHIRLCRTAGIVMLSVARRACRLISPYTPAPSGLRRSLRAAVLISVVCHMLLLSRFAGCAFLRVNRFAGYPALEQGAPFILVRCFYGYAVSS